MPEKTYLNSGESLTEELLTILESTYNGIIAINKEGIVTIITSLRNAF
ncbi:hypothetical protein BR63_10075 [Thermanaerosceptrum fracticalcis]|uniref:Uncharacterized protein n=1 Tax=Thermanaerosceptrum fracticalcis TaxID=1712410 RepID=A0A7G6E3G8_THEFR|nr:hypothetical protein [Thermanaerosceptrum fracticalcis]QNB46622.1 hypothetical protein BR63_10075 [Thermanaerosceptrum fracticalcis]